MNRILKSIISVALIVLAIYVVTTHNLMYYVAMIATAVVLGAWVSTRTANGIWAIPALVAVGIAWVFRWIDPSSALVAFAVIPGLIGLQSLVTTLKAYAPRKSASAAEQASAANPFGAFRQVRSEQDIPAHIHREVAVKEQVRPGAAPYNPTPTGDTPAGAGA